MAHVTAASRVHIPPDVSHVVIQCDMHVSDATARQVKAALALRKQVHTVELHCEQYVPRQILKHMQAMLASKDNTIQCFMVVGQGNASTWLSRGVGNLACLVMRGCAGGFSGMRDLACALPSNQTLHTLNLQDSCIGRAALRELVTGLVQNSAVKVLILANNPIEDSMLTDIDTLLTCPTLPLETLDLSRTLLTPRCVPALCSSISRSTTLTGLHLNCMPIGTRLAQGLHPLLMSPQCRLEVITMQNTGMTDQGLMSVSAALEFNHSVHTLFFGYNQLTDEGLLALTRALHHNSTLSVLDLMDGHFTNFGFHDFIAAATRHPKLGQVMISSLVPDTQSSLDRLTAQMNSKNK